jgi:hypothetical protein
MREVDQETHVLTPDTVMLLQNVDASTKEQLTSTGPKPGRDGGNMEGSQLKCYRPREQCTERLHSTRVAGRTE